MIWLTWRQFRSQFLVVAGVVVALAIILVVTGPHLISLSDAYLKLCQAERDCGSTNNPALTTDSKLQIAVFTVMLLAPALIGVFWGAPLIARELETGTYRLSWSQSVSRGRWLATKLAVVGLASVVVTGLLSLMITWWSSPIDTANANRFGVAMFGLRDIAPMGYAAFAFALGVTAGVLIRRTLPAMAATLVGFIFVRVAESLWVRPHFMAPQHTTVPLAQNLGFEMSSTGVHVMSNPPNIANSWVTSNDIVNNAGQAPTSAFLKSACPNLPTGPPAGAVGSGGGPGGVHVAANPQGAFQDCAAKLAAHYHEVVAYQPASRFWAFQGIETALFVLLSLALLGLCFWWVRRRLS